MKTPLLDPADQPGANMLLLELPDRVQLVWRCRSHAGSGRCREPATYQFRWPGAAEHMPACSHHCAWAWHVAQTMGFELDHLVLPMLGERLHDEHPTTQRARLLEVD